MPNPAHDGAIAPPTASRSFWRGVKLGTPILLGYLPVGMAFGILATTEGLTPLQAITCSATALAGAGQFIGLSLMTAGEGVLGVLIATSVVNLRYVLFGASLSTHMGDIPRAGQAALAYSVTDETFAVNTDDLRQGRADGWSMAGVGAVSWVGWVVGTAVGALAAGFVGDPSRFGAEFAMPAMFAALLAGQIENRRHVVIAMVAGALAVLFALLLPGKWFIVAASITAATIATVVYR